MGHLVKSVPRNAAKRVLVVTMPMVCVILGVSQVGQGSSVYQVLNIICKHSLYSLFCDMLTQFIKGLKSSNI